MHMCGQLQATGTFHLCKNTVPIKWENGYASHLIWTLRRKVSCTVALRNLHYYYYFFYYYLMSLVTALFFLVLLLNQR